MYSFLYSCWIACHVLVRLPLSLFPTVCAYVVQKKVAVKLFSICRIVEGFVCHLDELGYRTQAKHISAGNSNGLWLVLWILFVCLFFCMPHYLFSFQFCNFKTFSIDFLARMNTFSADSNCFGCEMWAI